MAKAVILRCDLCYEWDSDNNQVQTVGVAGPRFDLCANCRVAKIVDMGQPETAARRYVNAFDLRRTHRGSPPPLEDRSNDAAADVDQGVRAELNHAAEVPSLDVVPLEAETEVKPAGRRAAKK